MNILHLCYDTNFISDSRKIFDKYYPGENTFIVDSPTSELKVIKDSEGMYIFNLGDPNNYTEINQLFEKYNFSHIVLHGLFPTCLTFLKYFKSKYDFKVYWLFWGYELYETLGYENDFKLIDQPFNPFIKKSYVTINKISKIIRKFIGKYRVPSYIQLFSMIDYFCFWYIYDYHLLQKYYPSNMKYKYFAYGAALKGNENSIFNEMSTKQSHKIMINHQASLFGNHDTVFKKISKIDTNNLLTKIVPLSYGSTIIKEETLRKGRKLFGSKFHPILNRMPKEEYFSLLSDIDAAVFGQRRQEASGNIIQLLRNGVKIFLRNDNCLLEYYKSKGYHIYSFEDDLNSISDLQPLTPSQKKHNRDTAIKTLIYYDDFMPNLFYE